MSKIITLIILLLWLKSLWFISGDLLMVPDFRLLQTICTPTYDAWSASGTNNCIMKLKGTFPTDYDRICWVNQEDCTIYFVPPMMKPLWFCLLEGVPAVLIGIRIIDFCSK